MNEMRCIKFGVDIWDKWNIKFATLINYLLSFKFKVFYVLN
jgi:hypothetical protein